jgi:secreted PhoX family phosphatase
VNRVTGQAGKRTLSRNARSDSEFAGSAFSPDGSTFFVSLSSLESAAYKSLGVPLA